MLIIYRRPDKSSSVPAARNEEYLELGFVVQPCMITVPLIPTSSIVPTMNQTLRHRVPPRGGGVAVVAGGARRTVLVAPRRHAGRAARQAGGDAPLAGQRERQQASSHHERWCGSAAGVAAAGAVGTCLRGEAVRAGARGAHVRRRSVRSFRRILKD